MPRIRFALRAAVGAKGRAALFSIALVALTIAPITENFCEHPRDSFPLSYYPMFNKKRSDEQRLTYLVGTDKQGEKHFVHYKYAGAGGMNQVRKQLRKSVRQDRADSICEQVAKRIARKRSGPLSQIETIEVVSGTFRLHDFYNRRIVPEHVAIQATVEVDRD